MSFLFIFWSLGCATSRQSGFDEKQLSSPAKKTLLSPKESQKLESQAKIAWSKRHQEPDLLEAKQRYSNLCQYGPSVRTHCALAARASYLLAEYFYQNQDQREQFNQGARFAELGLSENSAVMDRFKKGIPVEASLDFIETRDLGNLYWLAVNLGSWARLDGVGTQLKHKDKVKRMIDHILKKDRDYFYYGADRYLGVFYSVIPGFSAEDLKLSKQHFETALKRAPQHFGTSIHYAQTYAIKTKNRDLFEKLLRPMIEARPQRDSPLYPEQILDQKRAQSLFNQREELF